MAEGEKKGGGFLKALRPKTSKPAPEPSENRDLDKMVKELVDDVLRAGRTGPYGEELKVNLLEFCRSERTTAIACARAILHALSVRSRPVPHILDLLYFMVKNLANFYQLVGNESYFKLLWQVGVPLDLGKNVKKIFRRKEGPSLISPSSAEGTRNHKGRIDSDWSVLV